MGGLAAQTSLTSVGGKSGDLLSCCLQEYRGHDQVPITHELIPLLQHNSVGYGGG